MESDRTAAADGDPEVPCQWSARRVQPVVLLWVALIFLIFIALGYFGFHSMTAVKTLAMTAVASIVPLVPSVLGRVEYRITERRLERRVVNKREPAPFETVFRFDEVSRIVPMRHGFKFHRSLNEPRPFRRFWKAHLSDEYSGEVHVERADREIVFEELAERGFKIG